MKQEEMEEMDIMYAHPQVGFGMEYEARRGVRYED